ncbi:hypothetical protein EDB81DRAFT_768347 [Dactylonectria macrodidyma]|uniref:Uncharacterized protein n=1 Tax=Dactylonectria macrodidyma TaxID=307937 RepID=A0A9P9IAC7_9HYPO|nr:hypothetical protein EDB81DRAFT_768347 [Dactylonectria macrodidyma]
MHVHLLRDDDVSADQRHGPTRKPQPAVNAGQPAQVELLFDAGRDMASRGGQIVGLGAVRCRLERQEPVVIVLRRIGAVVVLALEKSDGEGRPLLAKLLAQTRPSVTESTKGNTRLCCLPIPPPFRELSAISRIGP